MGNRPANTLGAPGQLKYSRSLTRVALLRHGARQIRTKSLDTFCTFSPEPSSNGTNVAPQHPDGEKTRAHAVLRFTSTTKISNSSTRQTRPSTTADEILHKSNSLRPVQMNPHPPPPPPRHRNTKTHNKNNFYRDIKM